MTNGKGNPDRARNTLNSPIAEADFRVPVPIRGPGGQWCTAFILVSDMGLWNADPDGVAAKIVGLSKPDYIEWVESEGCALCGATTKKGTPCKNLVGGRVQLGPKEWFRLHRSAYCSTHGGSDEAEWEQRASYVWPRLKRG